MQVDMPLTPIEAWRAINRRSLVFARAAAVNPEVKFRVLRAGNAHRFSMGYFGVAHLWRILAVSMAIASVLQGLPQEARSAQPPVLKWVATLSSESDPRARQFDMLSWSPNGKYLAGWSSVGSVVVYDPQSGELKVSIYPGRVRTIAWTGDGETLAVLIQRRLDVWELSIWSPANGSAVESHSLPEDGLPEQCRFIAPRPRDYAWLLLSRDGHSLWVGCAGEYRASTYPAAARFDLRTRAWSTIELTPAHPDLKDSHAPQFFEHQGRDLLSLTSVSLDRSTHSKIWLTLVDIGSGDARNIPLHIATPRQQVFCTLPHSNRAALTVAYASVKEGRPVPKPSYEVEGDYETRMNTVNLDRIEYSPPAVFDHPPRGSGCEGLSLLPEKGVVGFVSSVDKGLHVLDLESGSRMKAVPIADAFRVKATRDGKRIAIQRRGRQNNSYIIAIEIYRID